MPSVQPSERARRRPRRWPLCAESLRQHHRRRVTDSSCASPTGLRAQRSGRPRPGFGKARRPGDALPHECAASSLVTRTADRARRPRSDRHGPGGRRATPAARPSVLAAIGAVLVAPLVSAPGRTPDTAGRRTAGARPAAERSRDPAMALESAGRRRIRRAPELYGRRSHMLTTTSSCRPVRDAVGILEAAMRRRRTPHQVGGSSRRRRLPPRRATRSFHTRSRRAECPLQRPVEGGARSRRAVEHAIRSHCRRRSRPIEVARCVGREPARSAPAAPSQPSASRRSRSLQPASASARRCVLPLAISRAARRPPGYGLDSSAFGAA